VARYVALLRGINVGTAKRIAMADLRACFEGLGFTSVRTLLQSGNVVFDADAAPTAARLERSVAEATGVTAPVVVVSGDDLRAIAGANPLLAVVDDPSRALVAFVETIPDDTAAGRPADDALLPERIAYGDRAVYQWCPDGVSKSKLPPAYFARMGATARNLRTVDKLVAMLDD
jgi:uncharacterized protein (DUF1697 family)